MTLANLLSLLLCLALVEYSTANLDCFSSASGLGSTNYNNCCSDQTSGHAEVNGVQFDYYCGSWFSPTDSTLEASSARACAQLCSIDDTCAASTWQSDRNRCHLSQLSDKMDSHKLKIQTSPQYGTGYIAIRENIQSVPPASACQTWINEAITNGTDTCTKQMEPIQKARDTFERENQICNTTLRRTQEERDQLDGDNTKRGQTIDKLQREKKTLDEDNKRLNGTVQFYETILLLEDNSKRPSHWKEWKRCPEVHHEEITVGGVTYKQYCNQGVAAALNAFRDSVALSFDECVKSCSDLPWCQGINYWVSSSRTPCGRFDKWREHPGNLRFTDYLIGAIPLKEKRP
ncbi:uncharacterized protein BP01DRAFT_411577 [Aspergillus saccharolyticus JOP 1030-1]|uniref:Apple domain-containing protein n=1 Tax=Aspergillus saccharolyticus JOP 1030-1 TaxID=1450539 RepID=A0A318Z979_9EURO|nr:hypothetical protein BP01DRAFT_411577 [Aspergillus saccharolyticus JOP 1030-1]PYH40120.1 hypothetical protein BP01DRAFT_411577 [Aspergillus saccharolyticus JOP 1030-1]